MIFRRKEWVTWVGLITVVVVGQGFQLPISSCRSFRITKPDCVTHSELPRIPVCARNYSSHRRVSEKDVTSTFDNTDENDIPDKLLGTLVLLTVPIAWGTYVPVVRYLYAVEPPVPGFVFSACYYFLAAITTTFLALNQDVEKTTDIVESDWNEERLMSSIPVVGGLELGSYLFFANCLQIIGLRTVESDRAGFLVQLTTVMVPFVEAALSKNLSSVPIRTWLACCFAFIGLFIMGLDGKPGALEDPVSTFFSALSAFTGGDLFIIGAAVLYTLHVVRLGTYAKETTPIKLAASKATAETIYSILLVAGAVALSSLGESSGGMMGAAANSGKEIVTFFSTISSGIANGEVPASALVSIVGAVLWTGWVTCAYTIYAQSFGQSRVSPTNANLIYTFQPIFTAIFAYTLLGETMGPSGFIGGAIIASSVFLVASSNIYDNKPESNDSLAPVESDTAFKRKE